jgi:hypothetical protein
MAEAQFTPYLPPGGIVDAAFSGANQMQTLMDRGQQMRQRQEMADRQREIYDVGKPVMEAKAQADLAVAQGTLYNARQIQQLRGQFGEQSKQASSEYEQAMQLPTYEEQAKALSQVAQKYSYFELIPEGKPFIHTVQNMQLQQHNSAILNSKGQQALDRESLRAQGNLDVVAARGDEARKTNAEKQTPEMKDAQAAADAEASGDTETANFLRTVKRGGKGEGTAISLANEITKRQLDPKADPKITGLLIDVLAKDGHFKEAAKKEFLQNIDAMKKAQAEGDDVTYRQLSARNRYLATRADMENTYDAPPPPAPPSMLQRAFTGAKEKVSDLFSSEPIAAPAPPAAPANTKTVKIGDQDYPVYTDAKGNRAYHKDGKYYPIP